MIPINLSTISMAALVVAVLTAGWYKAKSEDLTDQVYDLEADVARVTATLQHQEKVSKANFALYEQQVASNAALQKDSNTKSQIINKYKSREAVVYAKPGLVERLEQKALDDFFEEVSND